MTNEERRLPDPRRFGSGDGGNALLAFAGRSARAELENALRGCLAAGRDEDLRSALAAAPDAACYRMLWDAAAAVAEHPVLDGAATLALRMFAIPVVIVAGSRDAARIGGVVPDIAVVTALLAEHGAIGPTRNFGLSNALVALETLERLSPLEVYRRCRDATAPPDLPPADIAFEPRSERVHLRFLIGAGFSSPAAPPFVETAANIGAWGMPLTRALAAQFAQPGVELLPMPRPPVRLLAAAHAGRAAQLGAAFNLFTANSLRRLRLAVGDPAAVLSAHDNGELRATFSTPLDESLHEGFRWPLDRLDDVAAIEGEMLALLAECRVGDVHVVPQVLPDRNAAGVPWFPRGVETERLAQGASRH